MVQNVNIAIWERHYLLLGSHTQLHYNKQLCTVWYTTASAGVAKGRLLTTVQHKYYDKNTGLMGWRQKVRLGFNLRRVGWAEGGTGRIRATVVAEGAGTCDAATAAAVGPLQHARLEI